MIETRFAKSSVRRLTVLLLLAVVRAATAASLGVGDRLPPPALERLDGAPLAASGLAGKPLVIDFWASWCATCRTAVPALDAMAKRFADRDVVFLAVNVDRRRAAAETWLAERLPTPSLTLARDPGSAWFARFGADGMPAVYVVDRTGTIRLADAGFGPERLPALERAIEAALTR